MLQKAFYLKYKMMTEYKNENGPAPQELGLTSLQGSYWTVCGKEEPYFQHFRGKKKNGTQVNPHPQLISLSTKRSPSQGWWCTPVIPQEAEARGS